MLPNPVNAGYGSFPPTLYPEKPEATTTGVPAHGGPTSTASADSKHAGPPGLTETITAYDPHALAAKGKKNDKASSTKMKEMEAVISNLTGLIQKLQDEINALKMGRQQSSHLPPAYSPSAPPGHTTAAYPLPPAYSPSVPPGHTIAAYPLPPVYSPSVPPGHTTAAYPLPPVYSSSAPPGHTTVVYPPSAPYAQPPYPHMPMAGYVGGCYPPYIGGGMYGMYGPMMSMEMMGMGMGVGMMGMGMGMMGLGLGELALGYGDFGYGDMGGFW